jgi:alpha-galactosidase
MGDHGYWSDPDQLMIGMTSNCWVKETTIEEQSRNLLYGQFSAPLFISADMRYVPEASRLILLNNEITAVNQDPLGKQGARVTPWGNDATVLVRELADGEFAVAFFNQGNVPRDIRTKLNPFSPFVSFEVTDLYRHKNFGLITDSFIASNVGPISGRKSKQTITTKTKCAVHHRLFEESPPPQQNS